MSLLSWPWKCKACGTQYWRNSLSISHPECLECDEVICNSCSAIKCFLCSKQIHLACSHLLDENRYCQEHFLEAARVKLRDKGLEEQLVESLELVRRGVIGPKRKAS